MKIKPKPSLTTVRSKDYRPIGSAGGVSAGALYWGVGGFGSSINGFHLGYVHRMHTDYQVSLCHDFLQAPIVCAEIALAEEPEAQKAQIIIKADDPQVAVFVKNLYRRIWMFDLSHSLDDIGSGYAGGEGVYKVNSGVLDWDYIKPFDALDCEPYTSEGRLRAVHLRPGGSAGMTGDEMMFEANTIDRPGKGLWFVNKPKKSLFYGRSDYYAAWHDWRVKSGMPDCVREIVFKATYKHAFSGMVVYYPEGSYVDEDNNPINNRDDAERICEIGKSGTNFAISGARNAVNGEREWAIDSYGKNEVDIGSLIPIVEHHDVGIRRGMNIPDEIIDHDGNTGGYSRSRVACVAFFMGRKQVLDRKVQEWKRQVAEPLVNANFIRTGFTIETKSLLRDDPEQGGGMAGMQPPGGGDPGMMGAFGSDQGGDTQMSLATQKDIEKFGKLFRHALKGAYESKTLHSIPKKRKKTRMAVEDSDGIYHGPESPGEGWKMVGTGPRGGKMWRYAGAKTPAKAVAKAKPAAPAAPATGKRAAPGSQLSEDVRNRMRQSGMVGTFPPAEVPIGDVVISEGTPEELKFKPLMQWNQVTKSGRISRQYRYTQAFHDRNAAQKFERVMAIEPHLANAKSVIDEIVTSSAKNTRERDAAAIAAIIAETGLRPTDGADSVKHGHYGIASLLAKHVKFDGDAVKLDFIGKEGVRNRAKITNPATVQYLKMRLQGRGPKDRVWDASSDDAAAILKQAVTRAGGPGDVMLKDLRTIKATAMARDVVANYKGKPPPFTGDEKKDAKLVVKAILDMSGKVAAVLNNTAPQARDNYIHPAIFRGWLEKIQK